MTPQTFAELKAAFRSDMEGIGCFHFDDPRHGSPLTSPPSHSVRQNARWTEEEDAQLREMWEARTSWLEIGVALRRTPAGIMYRINALGWKRSDAS